MDDLACFALCDHITRRTNGRPLSFALACAGPPFRLDVVPERFTTTCIFHILRHQTHISMSDTILSSKGQTKDEIAAEVEKRRAEIKAQQPPIGAEITVHNASTLSAYDIRQELNRRNCFDFKDEDTVNFRTMLKRLMVELVKDEGERAVTKEQESKVKMETAMEASKRIREEKKQIALERSRQRQADPEYFKKIVDNNVKPVKEEQSAEESEGLEREEEQEEEEEQAEVDPFRSFVPKGRAKIFIR